MTIIHTQGSDLTHAPQLDEFRKNASASELIAVRIDDTGYHVLGSSQFNSGGRTHDVSWVQGETDTTQLFLDTLSQTYGAGLSGAIAHELALAPAPGAPLSARSVRQALDFAETGRSALAGVDFLTFLDHSAVHQGSAFKALAEGLGLRPGRLDPEARAQIDAHLREQFAVANTRGESPVTVEAAQGMLLKELKLLTN